MSQSRFSIVLVGVSALLRRPLVSRLRPAAFTARGSGGFRRSALPSASAFAAGRVGLRAHDFRFSARTASGLPLGGLALPPSASEIAARWVGSSAFRFGDCRSAGWASGSRFGVALGELAFGLTASAFRHAPLRGCPRRVGLRAHGFRFSARTASELPSAGWPSGSRLPLSARTASGLPLGELAFGLTASAFRHAPIRRLPSAGWFFRWAGWPSGSRLPLFGTHRSAPPCRRREGRRSAPTRHLFHFKTLIPTC